MAKTVCKAKTGKTANEYGIRSRGKASIEWHDKEGKPQYYCYGYKDMSTEELIETCRNCEDNVIFAQRDLDQYLENKEI